MTQPAGPFQMPPPTKAANPVSAAGYWIGGAILVVGCGVALVWFVVIAVNFLDAPNDFDRFAVPGSTTVMLDDGDWMIYHEYFGADQDTYVPPPAIDVTGPDGRQLGLLTVSGDYNYSTGKYDGVAIYEFHAPERGRYTITASTLGEPSRFISQGIAIGRPLFDWGSVGGILGSLALGAVSFIVGLVVLIVTIVRRGRARRRLQPAMAAYGGPPPGGPDFGPPPYPAVPGPYAPPPPGASPPVPPVAPPGGPAPSTWPPPPPVSVPPGPPSASPGSAPPPAPVPPRQEPAPPPSAPPPSPWAAPGQPDHAPPEGEPDRPTG